MPLPRPTIKKITLEAILPDGTPTTCIIDDVDTRGLIALFWTDKAVRELLAPFYRTHTDTMVDPDLMAAKFPQAAHLVKDRTALTEEHVNGIWSTPLANGEGLLCLAKTLDCNVDPPTPTPTPTPTPGGGGPTIG